MIRTVKKLPALLVALTLCLASQISAHSVTADLNFEKDFDTVTMGDDFVGGWDYTVEGAPAGYEKGFMVIVKENDQYKVQVQVGEGTLMGENVSVKGKEISFNVMVEGGMVSVKLTVKGSTISGTSTSSDGSYTIKGTKSISVQ